MCWMLIRLEFNKQRHINCPGQVSDENSKHPFMGSLKKTHGTPMIWWYGDNYSKQIPIMISDVFLVDRYCCLSWELTKHKLECFGAICWIHDQYQGHLPKNSPKKTSEIQTGRSLEQFQKKNTFFVTSYFSFYWLLERRILIVMVAYTPLKNWVVLYIIPYISYITLRVFCRVNCSWAGASHLQHSPGDEESAVACHQAAWQQRWQACHLPDASTRAYRREA